MGFPMDEAQTLNSLARRIHDWAIRKKFYKGCPVCKAHGVVSGTDWWLPAMTGGVREAKALAFCQKNPGESIVCPVCDGRGSEIEPHEFNKQLMHVVGELDEAFRLTRTNTLKQLIEFTGRPGVVPIEGYKVVDPCVPTVPDKDLPGHPALAVELADAIIRLLDMARWLGLDVGQALMDKLAFNDTRPERHGKLH